jgi:DNA-binding NtrC family response regulator
LISATTLSKYLPQIQNSRLPVLFGSQSETTGISERDLLYKVLFEMRKDINDLKKLVTEIYHDGSSINMKESSAQIIKNFNKEFDNNYTPDESVSVGPVEDFGNDQIQDTEVLEESLSLQQKEIDMIRRALEKHRGKRKNAANELGISERTLYRKIKEYNID